MNINIAPGMTRPATADEAAEAIAKHYSTPGFPATAEHLTAGLYFRVTQDLGAVISVMEVQLDTNYSGELAPVVLEAELRDK